MNLQTPIKEINKIAAQTAPKFKKLGIQTVQDLLFYFPFRYEDYSNLIQIKDIVPNVLLTIAVKIEMLESRRSFRKKMLLTEGLVSDESGSLKVIWFNQRYINKVLSVGDQIYLSGKATLTEAGLEFHNPTFEKINKYDKFTAHTARIVPIYSSTEKLSQRQIRFLVKKCLPFANHVQEWLPAEIIKSAQLIPLNQAVRQIHFPTDKQNLELARTRLKFDEIFVLQARAELSKQQLLSFISKPIAFKQKQTKDFVDQLPFKLTSSQKKSAWEIIKDLGQTKPTNRLLEGDVGSGKTIAVAIAMLNALLNKFQVAYMAPTEILASQQFASLAKIFAKQDFKIALLTASSLKLKQAGQIETLKKKQLLEKIEKGQVDLIIGTHALIADKVNFHNLNFVIVDEQHRFGVDQRKALRNKAGGAMPHFVSMTATPIPRSLALTLYGDLNLSVIDELPKNRKPIETQVIEPHQRANAYEFVKSEINKGRVVFVVCPLIDPSDKLGVKAVAQEFERLDKQIFKDFKIDLLHGRLKAEDKQKIMDSFAKGQTKILVSTSVIEVGIDVPEATVILIESAERFGLAQLHQLRGRVGRSQHQSYCFLFTESDSDMTLKRLQALVQSNNGFELAEKDLEFRGPGEVYGMHQSGFFDSLKIAKLTDWPIIKMVKPWVERIFKIDPNLKNYPQIKEKIKSFEKGVHFE